MNVVDPIDIAEAAVSAIHYDARPRMFLNQQLRLPFSDLPESALAERSRSEKPRNFSPRKSRCSFVVKIVPDQKNLVPSRSQIFRQREICSVHSSVPMESSADDEPGFSLPPQKRSYPCSCCCRAGTLALICSGISVEALITISHFSWTRGMGQCTGVYRRPT